MITYYLIYSYEINEHYGLNKYIDFVGRQQ